MKPVIDLEKTYGIVFDGGGARGAYQIGAWKAMREAGVKISADRKSTRLNSSHSQQSRMPSSA